MKKFLNNFIKTAYNTYLCIRFPFLKFRKVDDTLVYKVFQRSSWYECIEKGWRKAFGIQLCKELKDALKRCDYLHKYRICDVKEKFGTLRIYDEGSPQGSDVQDIINKYDYISFRTCIKCGRPAKYVSSGWISPYCEDCLDDNGKAHAEKFYSDIPWYGWTNGKYYEKHNKEENEE